MMEWLRDNWLAVSLVAFCVVSHLFCLRGHGNHGADDHGKGVRKKNEESAGVRLSEDVAEKRGMLKE